MSIKYQLYPVTGITNDSNEKNRFYPRVICHSTINNEDIAEKLQYSSGFSKGNVIGLLEALADIMQQTMSNGESVHLEGIGYFQPTAICHKPIDKMNARNIKVELKDIVYRPDSYMKNTMLKAEFMSSGKNSHFNVFSDNQWEQLLNKLLTEQKFITSTDLMRESGANRTAVWKRIRHWMQEGKIRNIGSARQGIYEKAK